MQARGEESERSGRHHFLQVQRAVRDRRHDTEIHIEMRKERVNKRYGKEGMTCGVELTGVTSS